MCIWNFSEFYREFQQLKQKYRCILYFQYINFLLIWIPISYLVAFFSKYNICDSHKNITSNCSQFLSGSAKKLCYQRVPNSKQSRLVFQWMSFQLLIIQFYSDTGSYLITHRDHSTSWLLQWIFFVYIIINRIYMCDHRFIWTQSTLFFYSVIYYFKYTIFKKHTCFLLA